VLPDRSAKHDALLGIGGSARKRRAAEPDRFGGDQHTLGIHAVQDVAEAVAFLADAVLDRNLEAVDEDLVRIDGGAAHLLYLARLDAVAVEIRIEEREPGRGTLRHFFLGR